MLPKVFNEWVSFRPLSRNEKKIQEEFGGRLASGQSQESLDKWIITKAEAINALNTLMINPNSVFYEFYSTYRSVDSSEREGAKLIYDLGEIFENSKNPFHSKYPQIGKRYLQLSSIEGEYSYFYDKETDYLYGIDWNEMDDFFVKGKLKEPLFTSFYDFLEWYYEPV
jgi:hypothetical protein